MIRSQISDLGSADSAAAVLSNPAFLTKLSFPFVGRAVSARFGVNVNDEHSWNYMGREKFKVLLEEFFSMCNSWDTTALWVYGTQGYGKSYILAAFACYLCARENERVIYLPDCRELIGNEIQYFQAALLFAWSDDASIQNEITTLTTCEQIYNFLIRQQRAVFIIDQMNAFSESKSEISKWLTRCWKLGKAAVLSSSANLREHKKRSIRQTSEKTLFAYGGLSEVSLSKTCFCRGNPSNCARSRVR
jgi:hypothetical protein